MRGKEVRDEREGGHNRDRASSDKSGKTDERGRERKIRERSEEELREIEKQQGEWGRRE